MRNKNFVINSVNIKEKSKETSFILISYDSPWDFIDIQFLNASVIGTKYSAVIAMMFFLRYLSRI